jgi:hypothetical protein
LKQMQRAYEKAVQLTPAEGKKICCKGKKADRSK